MKNMEHKFLHIITRTNKWKWKAESGLLKIFTVNEQYFYEQWLLQIFKDSFVY